MLWIKQKIYWPLLNQVQDTFLNPVFLLLMVFILFVQWKIPANKDQKLFSVGFFQDIVWMFIGVLADVLIIVVYAGFLREIYITYFSFLTIPFMTRWPAETRMIIAIFVLDFLVWFHHWLKHKVPWFWYFHVIHHSQKEMNMFTDMRYHFVEYLISKTVVILPLMMCSLDIPLIASYMLFNKWYTRFYHANIKTNFGFLKYFLVTPQSHRVHHSRDPKHFDKNFGVIFSAWDHMFGTQYKNYEEYPDTGVKDETFPIENKLGGLNLITQPIAQMIYPFRVIRNEIFKRNKN